MNNSVTIFTSDMVIAKRLQEQADHIAKLEGSEKMARIAVGEMQGELDRTQATIKRIEAALYHHDHGADSPYKTVRRIKAAINHEL